jgi:hypothetical protein
VQKCKVFAKDDLELDLHTWTKGLDYEVIQKRDYFSLASNEGHTNIFGAATEKLQEIFDFQ